MPWDWLGAGCNRYIAELLSGDNAKSTACSSPAPTLTSYQLPSVYRGSLRPSVTEYRPGIVRSASYRPETDTSPKYFERRTRTHRLFPSSAYTDFVPVSLGAPRLAPTLGDRVSRYMVNGLKRIIYSRSLWANKLHARIIFLYLYSQMKVRAKGWPIGFDTPSVQNNFF